MDLQTRNLIIDTQYFVQNVFDFNRKELLKLRNLIENGSANLYLTDITVAEVRKQIKEKLTLAFDKIENGDGRYLKPLPIFKKILEASNKEKLKGEVLLNFEQFIKKWNVKIISSNEVNFLHVHRMYANLCPPFSDKKKKEFPDAFALEAIRIWRNSKQESAYLLSNDEDWQRYIKSHHTVDFGESPSLFYLSDLSTFIDSVIRKDEELKDSVKFADNLLIQKWDTIKVAILKEFKHLGFYSDMTNDEEVVDVYPINCSLYESDILSAMDEAASYELSLEIEVIVRYSIADYGNAFYDKEDDKYYNLNYVDAYAHGILQEDCTIDLSFEDGIERNFTLNGLEFDNTDVRIPFDEDDFIDINEWTRNLHVIVCGVKNGKITENGDGSVEFDNFAAAQEIFSNLNIDVPSKYFTVALGDKIIGPLRFETWRANELYSS